MSARFPTIIRRLASIGLLVGLLIWVLATYVSMPLQSCRDVLTASGVVVSLCAPWGAADLIPIGLVVIIALLLYPDVTEFGIAGLGSIKKAVVEQTRKTEELARMVQSLQVQVVQSSNVSVNLAIPDIREAAQRVALKDDQLSRGEPPIVEEVRRAPRELSPERATWEARLSDAVNELERYLAADGPRALTSAVAFSPSLDEWSEAFRSELRDLTAVRDTLRLHPERLSDDDVKAGIELAERLLESHRRYREANRPLSRSVAPMMRSVADWLSGRGWSTQEGAGSSGDLAATRGADRLIVEGKLVSGRTLPADIPGWVDRLRQLGDSERATRLALAVRYPAGGRTQRLLGPGARDVAILEVDGADVREVGTQVLS